jgi:chromosome segregation ATPase
MSKESTQEASSAQVKLLEYQRRVADMKLAISRLETNLRDAQKQGTDRDGTANVDSSDDQMKQQAKLLSDEVVRLRDKLGNSSGELLALKSRLQAALERASKAEEELASVHTGVGNDSYDSLERASGSRNPVSLARRRKAGIAHSSTIRSAMRLDPGQGDRTEKIGKVVDVVDSFAVTTGTLYDGPSANFVLSRFP